MSIPSETYHLNDGVALQLDPTLYTSVSEELMQSRGIIRDNETIERSLSRAITALLDHDTTLYGTVDFGFQDDVIKLINKGVLVLGTPILTNAGRPRKAVAACTVLPIHTREGRVDLEQFYYESFNALDNAIGTGYDLSELDRPATALEELNEALNRINAKLLANNQRPVASMVTLRGDHPDVVNFIRAKRNVDFSEWRLNTSLFVDSGLFEAAAIDQLWQLKDHDRKVVGEIPTVELIREIADCAHYCGEPGILFKDRIDNDNPTPHWPYKSTAPCAEVAMAEGEACQFSYINLGILVNELGEFDYNEFGQAVRILTRLLDASVEHTINQYDNIQLPLVQEKRRIGVGITGFADLLVRLKIAYDEPAAVVIAAQISEALDYHSKAESVELSKSRGPFPAYHVSRYLDPEWLRRKYPSSTGIIKHQDWEKLYGDIEKYGIRHSSTTAMPPTGASSIIVSSSKSLEPHSALTDQHGSLFWSVREAIETTTHLDTQRAMGELSIANAILSDSSLIELPYLRTACQIDADAHIAIQAGFQKYLDESVSKTINLKNSSTVDDVLSILWSAYYYRLKGVTVFRDGCLTERSV